LDAMDNVIEKTEFLKGHEGVADSVSQRGIKVGGKSSSSSSSPSRSSQSPVAPHFRDDDEDEDEDDGNSPGPSNTWL
jgi:hypothetical protein